MSLLYYNEELYNKDCTATGEDRLDCPRFSHFEICGFSTAGSDDLIPAFSSHCSSAHSWWEAHGPAALSIASECPHHWTEAWNDENNSAAWLNLAIGYSQCYEEAGITGDDQSGTEPTATSGPGVTDEAPKETDDSDSGVGQAGTVEVLLLSACGMAAAAVNAL